MSVPIFSPAELLRTRIYDEVDPSLVPGGVVVGPTSDEQQQQGCISLSDAGMPKQDRYLPLVVSTQIMVSGPSIAAVDQIARHAYSVLNGEGRSIVTQGSTGERFLIHMINIVPGPSTYISSTETWDELLSVESVCPPSHLRTPITVL